MRRCFLVLTLSRLKSRGSILGVQVRFLSSDDTKDKNSSLKAALSALKIDKSKPTTEPVITRTTISPPRETRSRDTSSFHPIAKATGKSRHWKEPVVKHVNREPVTWENAPKLGLLDLKKFKNYKPAPVRQPFLAEKEAEKRIQALNEVRDVNPWIAQSQGEKWKYPIDNDDFYPEEKDVSFHEHVHLQYLLDDMPRRGPVRRYLELVVAGLQKNPHMTVEMKKEHVEWLKEYLRENQDVEGLYPK
ncbi:small ribosomal subunit protein mS31-like [Corticium candelabrum]|uniref:small ribosomal subunit protein mS31-like n=1 Tax=Corticium candelabrum TaxID=121492 RepID=UPI002E255547|nr:small ribosomal subunit protein mS31-like [Corticium candelabrum]